MKVHDFSYISETLGKLLLAVFVIIIIYIIDIAYRYMIHMQGLLI